MCESVILSHVREVINRRRDGERERAVRTADKASPLILKENVFGSQSYVTASLFLFYLVDKPFLINGRTVSNKQCSSN